MLKLVVYIPEPYLEVVKTALFAAGAGTYENYDCCCWQVRGEGQFRPLEGSQPFIGQSGVIERVVEYRVEMLCPEARCEAVQAALLCAHPYEQPAYDFSEIQVN